MCSSDLGLTWVRLSLIWLLPGACPALPRTGAGRLPGTGIPDALAELLLAELLLAGCPAGSLLRACRLP